MLDSSVVLQQQCSHNLHAYICKHVNTDLQKVWPKVVKK